ncbi:MAG: glycosyltransferase family 9 protein [Bdellovibrionota bacterium]
MKNWVIQTSFLGDAVLTLPFLYRELEKKHEVLLVAAPRNISVFQRAKEQGLKQWSSQLHIESWDKKKIKGPWALRNFAQSLKKTHFLADHTYCIHRSFSTSLLGLFSGADKRIGFSSGAASFFYTDCVPRSWENSRHEIEKNLDLLRKDGPTLGWSSECPSLLGEKKTQKGVVAFSLGSPWGTKEWSLENALALMKNLVTDGIEVWLLGDKNFAPKADQLVKQLESRLVKNYSGKTGIQEWIDLISQASVVVSGDSAAVHVACDLNVPVVALFGPTVVEFGFAPWRKNARVLALDLECRPCDIHGPRKCPLGHHRCMKDIKDDTVYAAIREFLV